MITIRDAKLDEVECLNQLVARSVRALSQGYYSPQQIDDAMQYVFGIDTQLIADQTYYVIEVNGMMAGCGGWSARNTLFGGDQLKRGHQGSLYDTKVQCAKIRAFFIDPAYARQGLGKRLLMHCEASVLKAGFVSLELMATLPGEPLYRKMGFAPINPYELVMPTGTKLNLIHMNKKLLLQNQCVHDASASPAIQTFR